MNKKREIKLSKFEIEVMQKLWKLGKASVREIQEEFPEQERPAYTTIQTIINRLEEKQAVVRTKKIGNAFIFEPIIVQKTVCQTMVETLLELFGGSTKPLMAHLIETGKVTLEDIRYMEDNLLRLQHKESLQDKETK